MTSGNSSIIAIIDDDDSLRSAIQLNLEQRGYTVKTFEDCTSALTNNQSEPCDIFLCDQRLPDMDGLKFITRCKESSPGCAVILMSGDGGDALSQEALRAGAIDYLSKPFSIEDLIITLKKVESRGQVKNVAAETRSQGSQRYSFSNIIAESKVMKDIFETVKRLASFNTTVLITGESGTGKELLARAIHHNSPRRGKPFVAINCGAIPENLIESELFGHKKGSFTDATRDKRGLFEEANGGTIFLDEIGELPLHLQVKLLRTLQDQVIRPVGDEQTIHVDVRIIAATLRDLEDDVLQGRFRDDLYYRLNVVSLHIPALRERPEDIPILVQHLIKKHCKKLGLEPKEIEPAALNCLMQYGWRGNVRELENCLERALVLSDSDRIDLASITDGIKQSVGRKDEEPLDEVDTNCLSIKQRTKNLEIGLIRRALKQTSGNRTHAAKVLEISHRALLYKLKEYGIE